jgi:hypothetical protein
MDYSFHKYLNVVFECGVARDYWQLLCAEF